MLRGLRSRRGSITFNGALHLSTHLSTHRSRDNIRPPSKFSSVPGRAVEPDQRTCDHPTKHLREALSILRAHANSIASRRSPSVAADSFKDKPEPEHVISSRVQQDDEIVSGRIHSERISGILSKKDISDDDVIQVLRSIQSELNEIARSKGITPPLVKTSELPRSPLLDPVLVEARMRYHVTKGRPDNERTDFEARVSSNLYAELLATPLRLCNLTGVRLPSAFLLPFTLRKHPITGKPWQVPSGFSVQNASTLPGERCVEAVIPFDQDGSCTDYSQTISLTASQQESSSGTPTVAESQNLTTTVTTCYMLSSYEILLYASSLKPRDFVRIVPYRWKNSLGPRVKDIVWRKDMSRYVLDLLQNQTFRLLDPSVYFTTSAVGSSGGPAPTDLDSALDSGITWVTSPALHGVDSNKVIALLWLGVYGSEGHPVKVAKQKGVGINFDNTRTFSTLQGPKGTYLPVFNLTHILTRAQISQLRESHDGLRNGVLVLEPGKKSAGVLRWLWQLSLYVGLDTEVDATMGHHTLYVENSEHGGG